MMCSKNDDGGWPKKPRLTELGQKIFWNRQSGSYEKSDLTNHNPGEMEGVLDILSQIGGSAFGGDLDLIVLGGAVGCRDPKMIIERMFCDNKCLPGRKSIEGVSVIFNDLSPSQVRRAEKDVLSGCLKCGAKIDFRPGAIKDVCRSQGMVGAGNLILGVYGLDAFFSNRQIGNSTIKSGFKDYVNQCQTLGDFFWFDWLILDAGLSGRVVRVLSGKKMCLAKDFDSEKFLYELKEQYDRLVSRGLDVMALRVVSVKPGQRGYFISHWFDGFVFRDFLGIVFGGHKGCFSVSFTCHQKSYLFLIRNTERHSDVCITMLNNVFGNIRTGDQLRSLLAIKGLMSRS